MLEPKWLRLDNLQVAWINLQVGHNANFKRAPNKNIQERGTQLEPGNMLQGQRIAISH